MRSKKINEFTYEVKTSRRDRFGKARVYVWGAPEPEMTLPAPKERGVDPANDKAYDRYNRAVVRIEKSHLVAAMELGLIPNVEKIRHSLKAGCSCTCSPGFIIESWGNVDYHLTVKQVENVTQLMVKAPVTLGAIKG